MPRTRNHQPGLDLNRLWLPLIACVLGCLAASFADTSRAAEEIKTFEQFRALPQEQAIAGLPVKIRGVVVCYDPGWGQLYIHDGSETSWLNPRDFSTAPEVGQFVEITGTTVVAEGTKALTNLSLTILRAGTLPAAKQVALGQLSSDLGQWIEVCGRVRVVDTSSGRLVLTIHENGESCEIFAMGLPGTNDLKKLLGVTVRARGINATKTIARRSNAPAVFAPGMDQITVIQPADTNLSSPEVLSIGALLDLELGDWTNQPVRVNGLVVSSQPGQTIVVRDPTGILRAEVMQLTQVSADQRVDISGYLKLTSDGPILSDAWFELIKPPQWEIAPVGNLGSVKAAGLPRLLTRAADILKLHREEAAWRIPVRLRGVVTFADQDWGIYFVQDQSGGVYVNLQEKNGRAGQWVELTGQTGPGGFAPEILNAAIQVLGTTNFPPPARVDLADLAEGQLDAQWIEMEGVVRRISVEWGHLNLSLMTRRGKFTAVVPDYHEPVPTQFVDARVRVRGACGSDMNAGGQLIGITLHVPALDQIITLEPAPADPFDVASTPIAAVARFDPNRLAGRRTKVSGVLTLRIPGQGFFVQDASGGISVHTQQTNTIKGDAVDVLGFPALGDFSPALEEATFRSTGKAPSPVAQATTAEQILLHGTNDGQVVSLEARLLQSVRRSASPQLVLQAGSVVFTARIVAAPDGMEFPPLASGSVVRLTGVCSIHGGERHEPESLRLLLRSPADVVLLSAPPWLTTQRVLWVFGGLGFVLLVSLAWVGSLRRQVRRQTRSLREEIAERERMEVQIEKTHAELLTVSRQAGMAEVATSVLHNVGNVLNSVNVSATLVVDGVKKSKVSSLTRVVALMREHEHDLGTFIATDPKGKHLPTYLAQLSDHLLADHEVIVKELDLLQRNVEHIKGVVAMQQSYAKVSGVKEIVNLRDLVEDSLRMDEGALNRHGVEVTREFEAVPPISVEKHKVLQILVNLVRNAKHACDESERTDKQLTLHVFNSDGRVKVSVADNGIGIPTENLTRIFAHGFTTKKDGHGFGLHNGALAAKEMGGALTVQSEGTGMGATFILTLPLQPPKTIS